MFYGSILVVAPDGKAAGRREREGESAPSGIEGCRASFGNARSSNSNISFNSGEQQFGEGNERQAPTQHCDGCRPRYYISIACNGLAGLGDRPIDAASCSTVRKRECRLQYPDPASRR